VRGLPASQPVAAPSRHEGRLIRESLEVIESETHGAHSHIEASDQHIDVYQDEPQADVARPERYLWPALMSLWQDR
jgi:hypothetical protein